MTHNGTDLYYTLIFLCCPFIVNESVLYTIMKVLLHGMCTKSPSPKGLLVNSFVVTIFFFQNDGWFSVLVLNTRISFNAPPSYYLFTPHIKKSSSPSPLAHFHFCMQWQMWDWIWENPTFYKFRDFAIIISTCIMTKLASIMYCELQCFVTQPLILPIY